MVTVGVLALQGGVQEHIQLLQSLGVETLKVRRASDFERIDALVLPGGESTTLRKLLDSFELLEPLKNTISSGLPVLGTCAGMILLSKEIEGTEPHLALLDIAVIRNGYGSQIASGEVEVEFRNGVVEKVAFIRAPRISRVGDAEVLAKVGDEVVAVGKDNILAASFHPELTDSTTLHQMLIDLAKTV